MSDVETLHTRGPVQADLTGQQITVTCGQCAAKTGRGWLGMFLITATQHQAGALKRAVRLVDGHICQS